MEKMNEIVKTKAQIDAWNEFSSETVKVTLDLANGNKLEFTTPTSDLPKDDRHVKLVGEHPDAEGLKVSLCLQVIIEKNDEDSEEDPTGVKLGVCIVETEGAQSSFEDGVAPQNPFEAALAAMFEADME